MLLIGFITLFSGKVHASHDMGGFISYTHVSGNTYHVTVTYFRDCSGIAAPTSISVNAASVSCGFPATSTILNLTGNINSTPVCPSEMLNTTCNGGALPGEEMYIYEADITLGGACDDWIFSYTDCCLPPSVQNVLQNGMYFESTLDNLNIPSNNSPVLTSPSMGYICTGLTSTYNFGAVDIDGDSLSYALVTALDAGPIPMTYNAPYSGTDPMASTPAVSMDPVTGDLVFNPTMIMGAVIAIRIYEWRDGVLIASHFRQMIVQAISCTNNQPNFSAMFNVTGGVQTGPFSLSVCPGTPVTFQITATDVDALDLLALNAVSTYPGATFIQTGTNPATGTFSWTPGLGFIGTNIVVLSAEDDNCPYKGSDYQSVMFHVTQTTDAGPDVIHCPAQGPLTLNAIGGTSFTWSVVAGDPAMSCTSCASTIVSPTITTTYEVNSDLATCNNNDQVTVTVVPDFTFSVTPDASYCLPYFGTTPVSLTATPSAGSYTYSWDEVGTGTWTSGIQSPTYNASQAANLAVQITSSLGCVLSDTVSITTTTYDDTPDWSLASSAVDPCMLSPVDLTATVAYGATCDQYSVANIPFAPIASAGTPVVLGDDQLSGNLPIGFSFNFYCNTYTDFRISSNGYITFDLATGNSGCCSGGIIPTNDGVNNMIALSWNDLYPPGAGSITYETVGVAPNRQLLVNYTGVPHCCGSTPPFNTGQIILFESNSTIEIHSTEVSDDGSVKTQGIENATGTIGVPTPGMNSSNSTLAGQAYRFSNAGNEPYLLTWEEPLGTPIGTTNPITVNPATSTTYYAVLTDVTGTCVSGTQSITISPSSDVLAPVADVVTLSDVNAPCSVTVLTAPTATDNCSGSVTGTTTTTLPISASGTTVVTWTYQDPTGNTSTQTQNIIISDAIAPAADIVTLSDVTAECSVTSLTAPTATDNCSGVVTGTTTTVLPITAQGTTVVTWTYIDGSGNTSTQNQNIVIDDVTAPVANSVSLSDVTAECSVTSLTAPTATDNCTGAVTGTTTTVLPISTQGTTVVTWTYVDGNGNTSTQTQNVVIDDVTSPVATSASLADVIDACSVTSLTAPTATDNCTGAVSGTTSTVLPITAQGTTVVTWTYDDGNGNTSTQTQNVVINDLSPPVANSGSLADVTAECSVTSLTAPTATDNCTGAVTGTTTAVLPITVQGTTIVTWTYTDASGNSSSQTQNIVIDDLTAPIANSASLADVTSECSVTSLTVPTATDNCTGAVTGTTTTVLPISTQGTTIVTWTYDDGNGNTSTQTQNVVIDDVTAPIVNSVSLADVTAECSVTSLTAPTATDNCTGAITGTTTTVLPISTQGTTVVIWTYDDGNGNTSTQTQNVVIDDLTAPVANSASLADVTDGCSVISITAPSATDNCTGAVTGTTTTVFPISTQGTTVVTWTYDDGNGNIFTQTQNVVINDVTGPTPDLAVLADVNDECSVVSLTAPTATDNCSGAVTVSNDAILPITLAGTTVVTWTYLDGNGNSTTQMQNVIIDDATPPVSPVLSDFDGSCEVPVGIPTTTDNCSGSVTGTTSDPLYYTSPGTYPITWTFTDLSGNSSTSVQNIVVNGSTTYATVNPVVCGSYTAPSGAVYNTTGTYTDIIPNAFGCDSIITINLTMNPGYVVNMTAIYCQEFTVPSGTMTYYTSGVYNDTLTSVAGCDSVLVIDVTILQVDNTVTQSGNVLTANAAGAQYQWIKCPSGINVVDGNNQSYSPVYNGSYAVVIFENGCYDTSTCYTFNSADLLDEEDFRSINLYPNPSADIFYLEGENLINQTVGVYDMRGRLIVDMILKENKTTIDLSGKERGVYFLKIGNEMIRMVLDY